ncbi:MAG: arylsulfatase [Candidatus Hydrogenedentota bacterium]
MEDGNMAKNRTSGLSRRQFVAALGAASVAAPGITRGADTEGTDRPNFLVIISDQHRADCIAHKGNPDIRTPSLDALAKDGVHYEECFCPFPVCTPSRYSVLSGLYVNQHKGWNNRCTLHPDIPTFPKLLRAAGYSTACVGKMHFTPTYLDVGYDRMYLSEQDGDGRWDDDYHRELMKLGLVDINDLEDQVREFRAHARPEYMPRCGAIPSNLPLKHHSTEWAGRKALDLMDEWTGGGNLLTVSFIKPHHPFDPPPELEGLYDPAKVTLPPGWTPECFEHDLALHPGYFPHTSLTEESLRRVVAYYYATIEHIDTQIGSFVDALKRKGLYDNTVIVYLSDHGEYLGFHHMILKGNHMYDALARVPLIVKYPNSKRAGERPRELVSLIDVAPTILKQAGLEPADKMAGLDLAVPGAGRSIAFCESFRGNQVMARTNEHKLLLSRDPARSLLFDLKSDPLEQIDKAEDAEYAAVKQALTEKVLAWQGETPDFEAYVDLDAPQIDQPNVPPKDLGHRDAIIAYYRGKIREALNIV